jgi:SNF2 family DNA or RNA helicase
MVMRAAEILEQERKEKETVRAIVISEVTPVKQWPGDFAQLNEQWDIRVITGSMTTKQKRAFWASPPDIICTNYEYIKSIKAELSALVAGGHVIAVFLDEGHNLCGYRGPRSTQGKQAKLIFDLFSKVKYRYLASASLLDNPDSPRVWAPVHFLNPDVLPPTISLFERSFYDNFSPTYRYKQLKLKPSMVEELQRRLKQVTRRVLLEDTGAEVPEVITKDIYVEMSPKLRKVYRQLRDDALAWHEDRPISRADVLSRNAALLQVASGFVIDHPDPLEVMAAANTPGMEVPEHQVIHIDTSHKDKAMETLCGDLPNKDKLIVWAHFTHEIDHLAEVLPDLRKAHIARVDGTVTGAPRDEAIHRFKFGDLNTFLGHPAACGAGLNLQMAQHMCRWSRSHFITDHNQSMGRNKRAIREQLFKHLVYHAIMTDATMDVRTEMSNRGKREYSGVLQLDHLAYDVRNLAG